jgi:hypothetical protein
MQPQAEIPVSDSSKAGFGTGSANQITMLSKDWLGMAFAGEMSVIFVGSNYHS